MGKITMTAFLSMTKKQKIDYFNFNIADAPTSNLQKWEVALRTALDTNSKQPLKLYSGLLPFCKSIHIVRKDPNAKPQETEPTNEPLSAKEFLLSINASAKVASLFEGLTTEIFKKSDEDILSIHGVGKKTLDLIRNNTK
jgi:hypothetical protein